MNGTHGTRLYRPHSNIFCACRQCKQYDYADTAPLPRVTSTRSHQTKQKKQTLGSFQGYISTDDGLARCEISSSIDAETGERYLTYVTASVRNTRVEGR